jgi:hypothetical protein
MPLAVPDGLLRVQFIPTIASPTLAPTIAEFTAGTDISKGISAAPEGFTAETTFVEAPNLLTVITPKVAGRLNIPDSALNMYWADATGDTERTIYALFPRGTVGFLGFVYPVSGAKPTPAAGIKLDVFPITVGSRAKTMADFGAVIRYRVGIAVTNAFAEDIAILA